MKRMASAVYGASGLLVLALVGCGGSSDDDAPSISLAGKVAKPASFTSASLKEKYTEVTQDVSYLAGTTPQSKTYLGVPLFDVVQDALAADNNTPGATNTGNAGRRLIEHYVLSTATDGYQVAYSLGELSPNFGGSPSPNQPLIAYAQKLNGAATALDDSTDGPFRIIAPGDIRGGRYASNATKLEVGVPPSTPLSGAKPGRTPAGPGVSSRPRNGRPAVLFGLRETPAASGDAGGHDQAHEGPIARSSPCRGHPAPARKAALAKQTASPAKGRREIVASTRRSSA